MNKESFQIGWYNQKEDKEYTNNGYACAAWYEKVFVKAGKYPVYAREYSYNERERKFENKIKDTSIGIGLPGVITGDNFSSYFCGNMVGEGQFNQHVGEESKVYLNPYAHALAKEILEGNSNIELLPEFQAQEINFTSMIDNKPCKTYGIFNVQ